MLKREIEEALSFITIIRRKGGQSPLYNKLH